MNFNFSFAIINIRIILTINNTDTHCNYDITQCGNIYYTLFWFVGKSIINII